MSMRVDAASCGRDSRAQPVRRDARARRRSPRRRVACGAGRPRAPPALFKGRATITGNMDVRRDGEATLAWRRSRRSPAGSSGSASVPIRAATTRCASRASCRATRRASSSARRHADSHPSARPRPRRPTRRRAILGSSRVETWGDRWQRRASAS